MKKSILFVVFTLASILVFAQQDVSYYMPPGNSNYTGSTALPDWYKNLEKYWYYRYRLVEDFTYIGPNPGESLIAERRIKGDLDGLYNSGTGSLLENPLALDFASDQTEFLANYMGVLATEYEQLKQNNLSTARTLSEILYAQNAFDRLRATGTTYFNSVPLGGLSSYPATYMPLVSTPVTEGFFIRDDVPYLTFIDGPSDPLNQLHNNHFNRPYLTATLPEKKVNLINTGSFYRNYQGPNPAGGPPITVTAGVHHPTSESQDQLEVYFLGESLLIKYLDDPAVAAQRTKCQEALFYTMSFMDHKNGTGVRFWTVPDPNNPDGVCSVSGCQGAGIFIFSAFNAMFATQNVLTQSNSPLASNTNYLINDVNNAVYYQMLYNDMYAQYTNCLLDLSLYGFTNVGYADSYVCFDPEVALVIPGISAPINYSIWHISSGTNKRNHSWPLIKSHAEDGHFFLPHTPLIFQIVNGVDENWSKNSSIESMLNSAPDCGPWNYEASSNEVMANSGTADVGNITGHAYSTTDWDGDNRLFDAEMRVDVDICSGLATEDCDYNGLDYMWLLNLYAIQRGGANHPYLQGMMNSYYCENYNVNYPDANGYGSNTNKLKLNWLEYCSAIDVISGTNGWVDFRGAQVIDMLPGFEAQSGCFFYAHIQDYNCSGGDVGDGPYNFAELNPTVLRPAPGGDSVLDADGFRPIMYMPYGMGYNARPLEPADTTNTDELDSATIMSNLNYYKTIYKDGIDSYNAC